MNDGAEYKWDNLHCAASRLSAVQYNARPSYHLVRWCKKSTLVPFCNILAPSLSRYTTEQTFPTKKKIFLVISKRCESLR